MRSLRAGSSLVDVAIFLVRVVVLDWLSLEARLGRNKVEVVSM